MKKLDGVYKSKFAGVLEDVRQGIMEGRYPPGQTLPTELEFSDIYRVNRGTVSKVLNSLAHEGLITRKTRVGSTVLDRRDRKAAARLAGLAMVSRGHLFGELHSSLVRVIQAHHYFPVLVDLPEIGRAREMPEMRAHLVDLAAAGPEFLALDGGRAFPWEFMAPLVERFANIIVINRFETAMELRCAQVLADFEQGGYLAARALLAGGCRRIAFSGTRHAEPFDGSTLMLNGARRALAEAGLELDPALVFSRAQEHHLDRIAAAFAGPQPPDGMLTTADSFARRIQQRLEGLRLVPGRDYKLVGYYDTPWATEFEPRLTTISVNAEGMAAAFAELLADGSFRQCPHIRIAPRLVPGETA